MTDQKKILVIDDEELLTKTFSLLLEKNGYEVYIAKNGRDALAMTEEERFDLIICDIRMPGVNGIETIKTIRSFPGSNNSFDIPVIFVTGFANDNAETQAKELKPVAYLFKPFDMQELMRTIKEKLSS